MGMIQKVFRSCRGFKTNVQRLRSITNTTMNAIDKRHLAASPDPFKGGKKRKQKKKRVACAISFGFRSEIIVIIVISMLEG